MKNEPLPAAVQKQIDRFYRDYPPKEAEQIVKRYKKIVMSKDYRSANLGRTESHMVEKTRKRVRTKTYVEPKTKKKKANCNPN